MYVYMYVYMYRERDIDICTESIAYIPKRGGEQEIDARRRRTTQDDAGLGRGQKG